mgnify:CR=1 FL=1
MSLENIPEITLTMGQFQQLCQAIEDANRTLRRAKRGQREGYIAAYTSLCLSWDGIEARLSHFPNEFVALFEKLSPAVNKLSGKLTELSADKFMRSYATLYREVDSELVPALGEGNALLLRGMVALGLNEAGKP